MPKIRNIIIFIAIAAALILAYIFFTRQSPSQATLVSSPSTAADTTSSTDGSAAATADTNLPSGDASVAQSFLTLLLNVKNIKLDDSIFSDPAFTSLHDSSIVLVPDATTGRPNPFAQFGNDVGPIPGNATSSSVAPAITPTSPTSPTTPPITTPAPAITPVTPSPGATSPSPTPPTASIKISPN